MKAYLTTISSGEYEDYERHVEAVYLVPDHFDPNNSFREVVKNAKNNKLVRTKIDGRTYDADFPKLKKLYQEHLDKNYKKIEFII